MALSVDFVDGHVQLGAAGHEDKYLSFEPEGPAGNVAVVDSVTLDIHSPSGTVTKTEDDFSRDGTLWVYQVRFDEEGLWSLELSATDTYGYTENASVDRLLVRA